MYELKKEKVLKGKFSNVKAGERAMSNKIFVIREVKPDEIINGDEIFLMGKTWLKTSPVKNIKKEESALILETRTSIYTLKETE